MTSSETAGRDSVRVARAARAEAASTRPKTAAAAIIVGYRDGVTILDLVGEHDMSTADKVAFNIEEQIARGRGVVVSLTETQFLDSSILNALFQGDRKMLHNGRRLVLHGGDEFVRRLFEATGVSDQLLCSDSLEEAIEFASQRYA